MLERAHPGLSRVTHELPLFGESSRLAARALIAAGPGLAAELRPRLQRRPVVMSGAYLAQTIAALGSDPDPVMARLHSDETTRQLNRSRALADLFGFYGTPALVLGRTALLGAQPIELLQAVLAAEMAT